MDGTGGAAGPDGPFGAGRTGLSAGATGSEVGAIDTPGSFLQATKTNIMTNTKARQRDSLCAVMNPSRTEYPRIRVAVLVPLRDGDPGAPADRPIGRAALRLANEGVDVIFAHGARDGRVSGFRAVQDRWEPATDIGVVAAYDRYPSQTDPTGYAALTAGLEETPVANPMCMTLLCRDKIRTQQILADVQMPEIVTDPARFEETLRAWGSAYSKPRYGAFGRGVRKIIPGDPLPAFGEGSVPGVDEPLFLQRAVPPLAPWAGVSVRVLCQRTSCTDWHASMPAVRRSLTDPVVNASRGAEVVAGQDALMDLVPELRAIAVRCCRILAQQPGGDWFLEAGVDCVIDADRVPWLIEVNSRPRGRLEALADLSPADFQELHVEACARPLRYLAGLQ